MPGLLVNGNEREWAEADFPASVLALVEGMGLDAATVVAEVEGEIVPRRLFGETRLSPGQRVELVRFVGGG